MENDFFDIPGHENYEINVFGEIFKKAQTSIWTRNRKHEIQRKRMAIVSQRKHGYKVVRLDGSLYCLHKILAETFLENPNNCDVVDHLDGDKQNNNLDNLEWCTHSSNTQRAYDKGLCSRNTEVICVETGEVFNSQADASRWLKGDTRCQSHIGRVCRGERETAYGYHWRFAN